MKRGLTVLAVVVVCLAACGLMLAQSAPDRFVGTWKLAPDKSKFTQGVGPKQETIVIGEQGNQLVVAVSGSMPDGSPISFKYSIPKECSMGCKGKILGGPWDGVSAKRADAKTTESHLMKGGKEVRTTQATLGKDGKSMRITVTGADAQGNPTDGVVAFVKE